MNAILNWRFSQRLRLLFCAFLILSSFVEAAETTPVGDYPMALTVLLNEKESKLSLSMTLTNRGNQTVHLSGDSLPWAWTIFGSRIQLWLARPVYHELTEFIVMAHSTEIIGLAPGQSVSGSVNLDARFPKIRDALAEDDVMFFWAYRAVLLPKNISGEVIRGNLHMGTGLIEKSKNAVLENKN